ncbi:MAG: hypothetical protein LIP77_07120 [Planctomycetes bacterium]|nr:hypothetical protein [Planctomycetota bacterium]
MHYVGIAGAARAGKNTLAGMLAGKLAHRGFSAKVEPLAKPLKAFARCAGWRGEPLGAWRDFHQAAADALIAVDRRALVRRLEWRTSDDRRTDFIIVPDVRRPEEAVWIKTRGCLVFLPERRNGLTADQAEHESESHLKTLQDMAFYSVAVTRDLIGMDDEATWLALILLERYHRRGDDDDGEH